MIGVGIAGFGYWGPNLLRAFSAVPEVEVRAVCDIQAQALKNLPAAKRTTSFDELLNFSGVDAVIVATPVATHFDLALRALRSGRHVYVEKPMTDSVASAQRLVEEADRRGLTLMVDYPYLYSSAVRKIRQSIDCGEVGELLYYDSVRINLGRFQRDVNVVWDLAAHDLAILDHLTGEEPCHVSVTGAQHLPGERDNIAYLTLLYPRGLLAHVHVNWLAPLKVRRVTLAGNRRMILWDDLEPVEKVRIYDRGVSQEQAPGCHQLRIGYRSGNMYAPWMQVNDALEESALHFIDCIRTGAAPLTGGEMALRVVRQLTAATASLESFRQPS